MPASGHFAWSVQIRERVPLAGSSYLRRTGEALGVKMLTPIAFTLEGLAAGELRSSEFVDSCLDAIADVAGEGKRTFIRTFDHSARAAAKKFDPDLTAAP